MNAHFAIDGACDLDPAILQIRGHGEHPPLGGADVRGARQKRRQRAGVELCLTVLACGEQLETARIEPAVQAREQLQRKRRQHLLGPLDPRPQNLDLGPVRLTRVHDRIGLSVHGLEHNPSRRGNLTTETSHC